MCRVLITGFYDWKDPLWFDRYRDRSDDLLVSTSFVLIQSLILKDAQ